LDSVDIVDDVNALLKLGVGDSYRLEHIKQAYIQNKTIWVTDENYMKRMREKYLIKHHSDIQVDTDEIFENEPEDKETIHCWKCGKKGPLGANFCMVCGTSLFEVGTTQPVLESKPTPSKSFTKSIPLKIPIIVGIPVLILLILGVGYAQGFFDNFLERSSSSNVVDVTPSKDIVSDDVLPGKTDSKCGSGTFFDPKTNSCMLDAASNNVLPGKTDSKCGPGTSYDPDTNSCIIG